MKMKETYLGYLWPGMLIILLAGLVDCQSPESPQLSVIQDRGELRVVTIYSPASYFIDSDSETGFEYELSRLFAEHLDVDLQIIIAANKAEMVDILNRGEADIAAGLIKHTFEDNNDLVAVRDYYPVRQQVIYKNGLDRPHTPDDLYPYQLHIPGGVVRPGRLLILKAEYPDFSWKFHPDKSSTELIEMIENEEIAYAAIYSNELMLAQHAYPELREGFDISPASPLSWFIRRSTDISLLQEISLFFDTMEGNENLAELIEYFYGPVMKFDYVDQIRFISRISSRLPHYQEYFENAAAMYGLDWRLLAAMSYQESHWNERALSPTGVRGMMMLTLTTAKQVGVTNRLDPEQSIMGGSKYIQGLEARLPEQIQGPDRIWFALAAYNIGFGHVMDTRNITRNEGANPDRWQEVKAYLPYLQNSQYYKQTYYGYARGNEAVQYVEGIRKYYNTLIQLTYEDPPENVLKTKEPVKLVEINSPVL
jgi:membrane-bound lytic murein transglycosylase F